MPSLSDRFIPKERVPPYPLERSRSWHCGEENNPFLPLGLKSLRSNPYPVVTPTDPSKQNSTTALPCNRSPGYWIMNWDPQELGVTFSALPDFPWTTAELPVQLKPVSTCCIRDRVCPQIQSGRCDEKKSARNKTPAVQPVASNFNVLCRTSCIGLRNFKLHRKEIFVIIKLQ